MHTLIVWQYMLYMLTMCVLWINEKIAWPFGIRSVYCNPCNMFIKFTYLNYVCICLYPYKLQYMYVLYRVVGIKFQLKVTAAHIYILHNDMWRRTITWCVTFNSNYKCWKQFLLSTYLEMFNGLWITEFVVLSYYYTCIISV